jgi:hypothetical protein
MPLEYVAANIAFDWSASARTSEVGVGAAVIVCQLFEVLIP